MNMRLDPFPAALLLAGLAGCGGGSDVPATTAAAAPVASKLASSTVRLEACVVDQHFIPRERVPVRARGIDGRLIGDARSGPRGEVVFLVPVGTGVELQVDAEGGESLRVAAQDRATVVEKCLMARED